MKGAAFPRTIAACGIRDAAFGGKAMRDCRRRRARREWVRVELVRLELFRLELVRGELVRGESVAAGR